MNRFFAAVNRFFAGIVCVFMCFCPLALRGQDVLSALGDFHRVVKGETWESVAAEHGVEVEALRSANPDYSKRKLKKGMLLLLPRPKVEETSPEEPEPVRQEEPVIRTQMSHVEAGVLLPFSGNAQRMTELYRGILMAADSVRREGVDLGIHAWDSASVPADAERLREMLRGLDVVFAFSEAGLLQTIAEICREQGTRLVLPAGSGVQLSEYPLAYEAEAPAAVLYGEAARRLKELFAEPNYVVVASGSADERGRELCEAIGQDLEPQQTLCGTTLEASAADFGQAFSSLRLNLVVTDDTSVRTLNILLSRLKEVRRRNPACRIALIGPHEWLASTQMLLRDFYSFDTYLATPYYYNIMNARTKAFQRTYEELFRTPLVQESPSYAALGFDLGFHFLAGLSRQGDTFERRQGSLTTEPVQSPFRFERQSSGLGFVNRFVQFVHFTPEEKIELVR